MAAMTGPENKPKRCQFLHEVQPLDTGPAVPERARELRRFATRPNRNRRALYTTFSNFEAPASLPQSL